MGVADGTAGQPCHQKASAGGHPGEAPRTLWKRGCDQRRVALQQGHPEISLLLRPACPRSFQASAPLSAAPGSPRPALGAPVQRPQRPELELCRILTCLLPPLPPPTAVGSPERRHLPDTSPWTKKAPNSGPEPSRAVPPPSGLPSRLPVSAKATPHLPPPHRLAPCPEGQCPETVPRSGLQLG